MRAWWDSLEARERLVLLVGGIVAAVIVLWAAVWNPLFVNTARLGEEITSKERLLAEVTRLEASGAGTTSQTRAAGGGSLVVVVDQTIRSQGLSASLKRNQPNGSDGINLTFQSASFDTLIRWLAQLDRDHGISVQSASFSDSRQPGLVNSTLVLSRG
jgi:general secretion pathway protein M